jgi:hypothetical protein
MAAWYPWLVFAHLVGLVLFTLSHGASTYMAFRVRQERDPHTVAAILDVSQLAIGPMYIGLLLLAIGGLGAAWVGGLFAKPWIIASIIVFIAVIVMMYAVASPYYRKLRESVGAQPGGSRAAGQSGSSGAGAATASPEELAALLDSRRPEILAAGGTVGLLLLVWLMVIKPG